MFRSYNEMVKKLFKVDGFHNLSAGIMHAAIGVSGEAGELLDAVKKVWVYGKEVDRKNVVEELGDIEFYLESLRSQLGITRKETLLANQEKLALRYPNAVYTDAAAQARTDKAISDSNSINHLAA